MDAYTFHKGRLTAGIATVEQNRFSTVVALGESGRGRHLEIVGLDRHNPPTVADGRVLAARPKTISTKHGGRAFTVLTDANDAGTFLVRVCTQWAYTRGTLGRTLAVAGSPEKHASGESLRRPHSQTGRCGGWDDALWVLRPGDELQVEPEGGRKSTPYRLWVEQDGSLQSDTVENRELDLAMCEA